MASSEDPRSGCSSISFLLLNSDPMILRGTDNLY
jgi:hypothetical protein